MFGGRGIRGDPVGGGEVLLRVNVDLGEGDGVLAGELLGQLLVDRGDGFAWSAPICVDWRWDC